jgi:hypothetical protein
LTVIEAPQPVIPVHDGSATRAHPGPRVNKARWGPQFQALGTIVAFDAIAMINVLSDQEMPAEHLLHDQNVFNDVRPQPAGIRASDAIAWAR